MTADYFDDATEQDEAVITVIPVGAGLEFCVATAIQRQVILEFLQLCPMRVVLRTKDIAGATGMGEELKDCSFWKI
ncbi:MAG: hypothetical protein ABSH48_00820 [Verrucomicrobiota bacterium]